MTRMRWAKALAPVCLAWCLGVALQLQQQVLWSHETYLGLLALAVSSWAFRPCAVPAWVRGLWALAIWVVVSFSVTAGHALSRAQAIDPHLEGQDLDVVGVVQAMAQRQSSGWRFRFQIEQAWRVDKSGALHPVDMALALPAQVSLGWFAPGSAFNREGRAADWPEPVKPGERWRMRVRLQAPHGQMNPHGFDYELWMWERGIRARGHVRTWAKDPAPQRLGSTGAYPIESWRQAVRERMLRQMAPDAGDVQAAKLAGVVVALVTGDQAAIDRSDWEVFRITGVAHLMSISGLHVTMFAWLASGLVTWAWRKSALWGFAGALHWPAVHVGALSGLMLATLYALFSGWGIPAQRTLLMLLVVVVLKISARHWHGLTVWLTACAVVLVWDPWAWLQPGFWLSFVAVGVLMAHRPQGENTAWDAPSKGNALAPTWRIQGILALIKHHVGAQGLARGGARGLHKAGALLREQATITVALAPLTLLFFGQVSLVSLLANLLAIPMVTLLITPLAMLGVLYSPVWALAAWVQQALSAALNWLATWPLASVQMAMPPGSLAGLALLGALACVLRLPLSWKVLCLPLMWPVLWWSNPRPAPGAFELLAADVGQGTAVLVRTATHSLLYDAGPRYSAHSDAGQRLLVPMLAHMGERIDKLMLSHRDSDHTGGGAAVLAAHAQARLWSSLEDEHPLHALRADWRRCHAGQSWVWDGVLFEVLHPAPGATSRRPNELSCVLRISQGGRAALLAGDIEAAQERALVQAGLAPVDVLLVPHHGSKTSSTAPFLQALQPQVALVQAAHRSRFGHPAPEVVARLREVGSTVVQSAQCGAATWRSDAPGQVQCERILRKRYWHHDMAP